MENAYWRAWRRPEGHKLAMVLPPIQPLPAVMTTTEVAALLRCSESTVERYVHAHELDAIQIGRERRFRAEDVLEFVAARPSTRRTGHT